jgi:hypothetical protein
MCIHQMSSLLKKCVSIVNSQTEAWFQIYKLLRQDKFLKIEFFFKTSLFLLRALVISLPIEGWGIKICSGLLQKLRPNNKIWLGGLE